MKAIQPNASLAQEQFLTILSREEAAARFDAALFPRDVPQDSVALPDALGRVLARDVCAPIDVPPFDRSNVDGFALRAVVGGDARVAAISAASILAKTARDARMRELALEHPGYGFERHMGYPTREHFEALARLGPCAVHRRSFGPVARAYDRLRSA